MDRAERIVKELDDYLSSLSIEEKKDFLKSMGFKFKGGMAMKKNNTTPEDEFLATPPRPAQVKKQLPEFIYVIGFFNTDGDNFNLHEKWFNKELLRSFEFIDMSGMQYVSLDFGDGLMWISSDVKLFKTLT